MVAAAIIGAAVVGGVATSVASSNAASATKSATNASIAAQQSAQQQQQALNAPYASIGTGQGGSGGAIQQYQNLLGIGGQGQAGVQSTLANTPGYQFAKQQGLDATKNAASASGMSLSGNTLQALDSFSTGLADSTYQQALGNAQNAVTIGQNAAAGTGAGIMQTGSGVAGALMNQGNTLAGIGVNEAAGISKAIGSGASQYATMNTLQGLNNPGGGGAGYNSGIDPNNYANPGQGSGDVYGTGGP